MNRENMSIRRGISVALLFLFSVLILNPSNISAQDNIFDLPAIDTVYEPAVKTVLFYKNSPEETLPVLSFSQTDYLQLEFDLLEGSPRELYYSIFHFDQNWNPDELRPEEFLKGFQEEQIMQFASSRKTRIPYIHYQLTLQSELFNLSGNYLICISDRFKNVLFTRRFYLSDNKILVSVKFKDPADASKYRSHQALELAINTNTLNIQNNSKELAVYIFQNGDPNTKVFRNIPNSNIGNLFYFNKTDDILYKGIKEFRHKDIRTLRSTTQDILYWDEKSDYYHCWLLPDDSRLYKSYLTDSDINGRFISLNREEANAALESEYILAHFVLNKKEPLEEAVYIYGGITDWQLKPDFLMDYDPTRKAYFASVLVKMGYYNFMYAIKDQNQIPDTSPLEGDWYETENDYNVLIYFRPFGSRYDQLLFVGTFNSNQ